MQIIKINLIILFFAIGFAFDLDPGDPKEIQRITAVQEQNLANKTVSLISSILLCLSIFCFCFDETRIMSVIILIFTMIFAVSADEQELEFLSYEEIQERKLNHICANVTNSSLRKAFSAVYPEYEFMIALDDGFEGVKEIDIELSDTKKRWIQSVINRMRSARNVDEFIEMIRVFMVYLNQTTRDCKSMFTTIKVLQYLEKQTETKTFRFITKYSAKKEVEKIRLHHWEQVILWIQSFFILVVPVEMTFSILDFVLLLVVVVGTIILFKSNKIRRRLGEVGIILVGVVLVIVFGFIMFRF